jgi:hypothetical protein
MQPRGQRVSRRRRGIFSTPSSCTPDLAVVFREVLGCVVSDLPGSIRAPTPRNRSPVLVLCGGPPRRLADPLHNAVDGKHLRSRLTLLSCTFFRRHVCL